MGFFDLNIPFTESDKHVADKQTRKATRLKLLIKTMELGYSGIAYNHTIKGVMSESDRCSISLLPLSSLLKLSPSLSTTVSFHRRLLNLPQTTPFRQYTRLTVVVDSPPQAAALNSGNPVLKSYDIVAVRPLNQNVFEHACLTAEVDLIAIDFGEKLPFRLKQSLVKAAIQRGVCFEITYSSLIADAQVRRQVISNAKLLVDWTRGKNLIFSSAAPSVTEIRGPYDVANLSMLLGISMERAKAAISKTCRSLLANALRRKQFYKEAIRVELIPSDENLDHESSGFDDWLQWDPISSGEGDLHLDEIAKSFGAASKASKTIKAINFASVMDSLPAHGLQIKDLIGEPKETSDLLDISKTMPMQTEPEMPVAVYQVPEEFHQLNLSEKDHTFLIITPEKHHTSICEDSKSASPPETLDILACTEVVGVQRDETTEEQTLFVNTPERHHSAILEDSRSSSPTEILNDLASGKGDQDVFAVIEEETKISNDTHIEFACPESEVQELQSEGCKTISGTRTMLDEDNAAVDTEMDSHINAISTTETSSPFEDIHSSPLQSEEIMNVKLDLPVVAPTAAMNDALSQITIQNTDDLSVSDTPLHQGFSGQQQYTETMCNLDPPLDGLRSSESYDVIQNTLVNSTQPLSHHGEYVNIESAKDVAMEDQIQIEGHAGIHSSSLPEASSERIRRKQRTFYSAHLFPFKRLLNSTPFKKKVWRLKNKSTNFGHHTNMIEPRK